MPPAIKLAAANARGQRSIPMSSLRRLSRIWKPPFHNSRRSPQI
jgi:hypothetical protein